MSDVSLICDQALNSFLELVRLHHEIRNRGLKLISRKLESQVNEILEANSKDLKVATKICLLYTSPSPRD